jgi:hypothetical protein
MRPDLARVPDWYHKYIEKAEGDNLILLLEEQRGTLARFLRDIPKDKRDYRYAPGKWTIRDLLQHLIDAERVFAYRSLRFARKDSTPLPGFEENDYAEQARAARRDWEDMVDELQHLRRSNIYLFKSFDEEELESSGIASGSSIYVRALGFILVGHINHHLGVIRERYLGDT